MRIVNFILHFLLAVWFAGGVTLLFLLFVIPGFFILSLSKNKLSAVHSIRRAWFKSCLIWGGIKIKQVQEQPLSPTKPYVIVANHTSKLDIITLPAKIDRDLTFMANGAFLKIPFFGYFLRKMDIPVHLKSKQKSAVAHQKAGVCLQAGSCVVIFPEATISRVTPKLSSFKDGAFRLAIEQQVELVPVVLIHHWERLPDENKYYFSPGSVIQYVHAPISTQGMRLSQVEELKQQVFHIIANKLAEHGYKQ